MRHGVRLELLRQPVSLPRVENLRINFSNRAQPDRLLGMGVHRVVREATGHVGVGDQLQGALLARLCVDRRGLWLQVPAGMRGVHVNGRPVQRMAQVRAGDAIYVDGVELLLQSDSLPAAMPGAGSGQGDPRVVLRGVGGKYHGRSIALLRPCLVGRGRDAGIRIDDPLVGERHAQLELQGDRVLLKDLGSADGSWVNGVAVRDALLQAGDQVAFDAQHRFVVEVPWTTPPVLTDNDAATNAEADADADALRPHKHGTARRWPWLLLAALLLGAAISALLLFGAG